MDKLTLSSLSLEGKKILMRVDFNVPLNDDLEIVDPMRIEAALPSIKYVLDQKGSVILMSHLGRPGGEVKEELSLKPCATALSALLSIKVQMAPDCIGEDTDDMKAALKPKEVLLLENLRFHRAEEYPDPSLIFSKELAEHADYYVNDAFGCSHRYHASITEVPKLFLGKAAAGFLLEKEISILDKLLKNPNRPFYAIIGGAKISGKLGVIKSLLEKVDALLIGGGMAYTFLKAQGKQIGNSLLEEDLIPTAKLILEKAAAKKIPILLPIDVVAAESLSVDATPQIFDIEKGIPQGFEGLDIGPQTISAFCQFIKSGKTVLWNGPVGVYEITPFAKGTKEIALALKDLKATTVVGGGDTLSAINELNIAKAITHISTGGGATLEFLEHGTLPGIEVLSRNSDDFSKSIK